MKKVFSLYRIIILICLIFGLSSKNSILMSATGSGGATGAMRNRAANSNQQNNSNTAATPNRTTNPEVIRSGNNANGGRGQVFSRREGNSVLSIIENDRGSEFRLNIPGGKARILMYGQTSIYFIKRKVAELRTNAFIKSIDTDIFANRILYFEKNDKRKTEDGPKVEHGQAFGNVRIIEKKKKVYLYGSAAFYHPKKKYMRLSGGAKLIDKKERTVIVGQTMERYTKTNTLIVTGGVRVIRHKDGTTIVAQKMNYNSKTKKMILIGNVVVTEKKKKGQVRIIKGDHVVFVPDKKKRTELMIITGNGFVKEIRKGKFYRQASANKIRYFVQKDKDKKKIIENIYLVGFARMITKKQNARAMKITMKKNVNKKIENVEFVEKVYIQDRKTKDEMRGGYAFFNKITEIMRVTERPSFYVYKDKAMIYSDIIKSYRKVKKVFFIGDVEIMQEDKRMYGEKALFKEKQKKIIITGEPVLIDKNNITYAETVTLLTKKKEVRLSSRFHGTIMSEEPPQRTRPTREESVDGDIGDTGSPEVL